MIRKILSLFIVSFLFCVSASAQQPIQITLHLSKQLPGASLYGDLLEQKPSDSFGTVKVSVVTDGRSARVAWNGIEYHGVVITSDRGESHIVYTGRVRAGCHHALPQRHLWGDGAARFCDNRETEYLSRALRI